MSMAFAGCGFLGLYYAGVAVCFRKYASHLHFKHISGASAGALAACCLLCDTQAEDFISDMLDMVGSARSRTLGPFSPSFNLTEAIRGKLWKLLPEDAHVQVSGRLRISLTRVRDGKNVIVSQFDTKGELIDCLLASSFVPIFSGLIPPKFRGVRYIDGMFTDNLPRTSEDTITVSPFCGESDICPRNDSTPFFHLNLSNTSIALSLQNILNIRTIVWPPSTEVLAEFCKQGFEDTLRFLERNDHINCTRCLSISSTYIISEEEEPAEYDPQCDKCEATRQEAVVEGLPKVVESIFQDYIDSANKGFYHWLLSHRGVKLITVLTLPYTIPLDCAYAFVLLIKNVMPHMVGSLKNMYGFLMDELVEIVNKLSSKAVYKLSATLRIEGLGGETKQGSDKRFKIDFHIDDKNLDLSKLKSSGMLSRRSSLTPSSDYSPGDVDTYDHILQVATQHDAILAFYYTDENKKLRVTEIFDLTDCPDERNCVKIEEEPENCEKAFSDESIPILKEFDSEKVENVDSIDPPESKPIDTENDLIFSTDEDIQINEEKCVPSEVSNLLL